MTLFSVHYTPKAKGLVAVVEGGGVIIMKDPLPEINTEVIFSSVK